MGGNSTTNTVTKQDNTPWQPAQAPLTDIYGNATKAYNATPKTAYNGLYIAPQSQSTVLAQQLGSQLAQNNQGMGNPVASNATDLSALWSSYLNNGAANATANPGISAPTVGYTPTSVNPITYSNVTAGGNAQQFSDYINSFLSGTGNNGALTGAVNAALQPIQQNLQQTIIPQAKLNAVGSGVYGGDAGDIAMSKAINDNYTTTAANTTSNLTYQDYLARLGMGSNAANSYFTNQLAANTTNAGNSLDASKTAAALALQSGTTNANLGLQANTTNAGNALDAAKANEAYRLQGIGMLPGLSGAAFDANKSFADQLQAAYGLNALPIDTMTQIGQAQDSYAQDTVKALYQQWMDQLNAPWQGLDQYRQAVAGYPVSSSGSSTGTTAGGGLF